MTGTALNLATAPSYFAGGFSSATVSRGVIAEIEHRGTPGVRRSASTGGQVIVPGRSRAIAAL
ncbi:hypothetical protein GCM10022224_052020 [Nonomuraea antimicrobica]|uniref:Uncharacterized protein n=1 Tax=Nonomuraea antimicrobica TaxID=561173 RepID=A0ABP7C9V7_9ACTN